VILISVTNGWALRNYVRTGLISKLSGEADVHLVVEYSFYEFFDSIRQEAGIKAIYPYCSVEGHFWKLIRRAKKFFFQAANRINTARTKFVAAGKSRLGRTCRSLVWALASRIGFPPVKFLDFVEYWVGIADSLPGARTYDLVVAASPFDYREACLLRSAWQLGIPTLAVILSWDNVSTKGCLPLRISRCIVWGDELRREFLSYYGQISPERIQVGGIPQFDAYLEPFSATQVRAIFCERFGISPEKKIILYGTCSPTLFPEEPEVVWDLAEAISGGNLGSDCHMFVRCHPADDLNRYRLLAAYPFVTLCPPSRPVGTSLDHWIPPPEEIAFLRDTLVSCCLCINTASSLTLDAIACGRPVVNVAYDGSSQKDYFESVRRFYDYSHYEPLVRSGAIALAESKQGLIAAVRQSLMAPAKRFPQEENLRKVYCLRLKGGAVSELISQMLEMARQTDIITPS
jgi:hypothetical protein